MGFKKFWTAKIDQKKLAKELILVKDEETGEEHVEERPKEADKDTRSTT